MRFNAIESGLAKLSWSFLVFLVVPSPTSAWRLVPFTSASKERRLNHHSVDKPTRLRHLRYIIYPHPEISLIQANVFWTPQSPRKPLAPPLFDPASQPASSTCSSHPAHGNRERMPREGGFHPFKGRVSRHFGDSVCLVSFPIILEVSPLVRRVGRCWTDPQPR